MWLIKETVIIVALLSRVLLAAPVPVWSEVTAPRQEVQAIQTTTVVRPDTPANHALLKALQEGNLQKVKTAFDKGADINATVQTLFVSASPDTPKPDPPRGLWGMTVATSDNQKVCRAIFREFIDRGLDVKASLPDGQTPLFIAVALEDAELVKLVLDKGAEVNAGSRAWVGGNPVNLAVMQILRDREDVSVLKVLLEHGGDPNVYNTRGLTPLHEAALIGQSKTVALLLKYGADTSLLTKITGPANINGHLGRAVTALALAQRSANPEVLRLLTEATKNISAVDAATTGNADVLKKHLAEGFPAESKDDQGTPFLTLAAASGNDECVSALLAAGAKPNVMAAYQRTPLSVAASYGRIEIVLRLLNAGANPNTIVVKNPEFPETALTGAIRSAEPGVVALLLKRGADLNAPGNRDALRFIIQQAGRIPMRRIGQNPKTQKRGDALLDAQNDMYEMIVSRMNIKTRGGEALCEAIDAGQLGIAEDLIERGASVNGVYRAGKTALMLTVERIGLHRYELSPEIQKASSLEKAPEDIRRGKEQDRQNLAFLRLLLSKRPNVNALGPLEMEENGKKPVPQTALRLARMWELKDVEALLKRVGAKK